MAISFLRSGRRQKMIYINGVKASKQDLKKLLLDIEKGTTKLLNIRTTKKGATALTVDIL
jgi:hypothetical protein